MISGFVVIVVGVVAYTGFLLTAAAGGEYLEFVVLKSLDPCKNDIFKQISR